MTSRKFTTTSPVITSTYFIKAVLSCSRLFAQAHEHLPIANDSLSGSWLVGRAQLRLCHHALNWLPCPLVMRVARRLQCRGRAHDPLCGTPLPILVTRMLCLLVTINGREHLTAVYTSFTTYSCFPPSHHRSLTFGWEKVTLCRRLMVPYG
jgi:hypothetical protein